MVSYCGLVYPHSTLDRHGSLGICQYSLLHQAVYGSQSHNFGWDYYDLGKYCVLWNKEQGEEDLRIPFPDGWIGLNYGWCFYLNLFTGIVTLLGGIILWIYLVKVK